MYVFKVGESEYRVQFGYGVLYKTDLIDRVLNISPADEEDTKNPADLLKNLIGLTAELLLAGLQRRHKDEFGFETDEERNQMILKVCDLIDDYEEEHTDEDGNRDKDGFTLFSDLQGELERNGFLSQITKTAEVNAAKANVTKMPTDHKKKAGESK